MRTGLSLCMIVRDEADRLSDCLKSVQGLVREMVVVDTGSSDGTIEVARSWGARVYSFAWNDDFSAARNHSLGFAGGEWILVLDADEMIDGNDHPRIRRLIQENRADGYRLIQRTYARQSARADWQALADPNPLSRGCPGYTESPLVRLFRNDSTIKFRGRLHELVEHDLYHRGRRIFDTDIPIHHYGNLAEPARQHRKHLLYQRIGEKKTADHPGDSRSLIELGVQYLEMGRIDAAVSTLGQAVRVDPRNTRAVFNLAIALTRQGHPEKAIKHYKDVLVLDPAHIGACNNLAQVLLNRGGYGDEVERLYRQAIRHRPDHPVVHYNLGVLLERENRHREAQAAFRQSLTVAPDFQPAKARLDAMANPAQNPPLPACPDRFSPLISTDPDPGVSILGTEAEMDPKTFETGEIIPGGAGMNSPEDILSRIRACMDAREYETALALVVDALEQSPLDAELRYLCGYALEHLGRKEDAIAQYQEALAVNPKHADTLFQLALEAESQGLMGECRTLYHEIFEGCPDHPQARQRYARLFEPSGVPDRTGDGAESLSRGLKRLNIVFVWGGPPFSGDTLEKRPVGGTETAMIYISKHLSRLGHSVRVFAKGGHGVYDGVVYRDLSAYVRELEKEPADVLVAARIFHPFITPVAAKIRTFWTEDAHDQPFVEFLSRGEIVETIDRVITVSRWQTEKLSEAFKIPLSKFYVTRNGIDWEHFKDLSAPRNRFKLVYTSTPFRGLDVLLEIFPRIKERIPQAELDVYSSMAVYQVDPAEDQAQFGHLYRLADQPGVTLKGSVRQKDLAEALKRAALLAYPNHFAETSCIAVMEAMAAGVPVVTTSLGALPETLADAGQRIDGDPRSEIYKSRFVDEVCNLLIDAERWRVLSRQGRHRIHANNLWDTIAKEWESEFQRLCLAAHPAIDIKPECSAPSSVSPEQRMPREYLAGNHHPIDPYFGRFFSLMREALEPGGSEFGLGVGLFSLAVSINASKIVEIGRFKGFSTLALASALKLLDIGWQEPAQHKQRPDIDYSLFEHPQNRRLYSIDPCPTKEAEERIQRAGLSDYIELIDRPSADTDLPGTVDLVFIDGDHSYQGCRRDVERFVPAYLRPGGYFVLHDYFGWYDQSRINRSPIKRVVDELVADGEYEHLLMDTGYQSFVVFRKPNNPRHKTVSCHGR